LVSAALYPVLPDRLPVHWNLHGEIDGWGSKQWAAFFSPGLMLVLSRLLFWLPKASPRRFQIDAFRPSYNLLVVEVTLLLAYIHIVTLATGLFPAIPSGRLLVGGLMLMFAAMGNLMGKIRRNFWVGVRTPWTLASDRVWIATHRLAARLMVGAGLLSALLVLAGGPVAPAFLFLIACLLIPAVYSYLLYRREEPDSNG
jgi:uncharacterized membrane protein